MPTRQAELTWAAWFYVKTVTHLVLTQLDVEQLRNDVAKPPPYVF